MNRDEALKLMAKKRSTTVQKLDSQVCYEPSGCGVKECLELQELMAQPPPDALIQLPSGDVVAAQLVANPFVDVAVQPSQVEGFTYVPVDMTTERPRELSDSFMRQEDFHATVARSIGVLPPNENILEEANRLVNGDRGDAYGHPLDDYTRTAGLVSSLLSHKLKEPLSAEEMILIMCCVKLSRQVHQPKRDNMTDLAGYALCEQKTIEERELRKTS